MQPESYSGVTFLVGEAGEAATPSTPAPPARLARLAALAPVPDTLPLHAGGAGVVARLVETRIAPVRAEAGLGWDLWCAWVDGASGKGAMRGMGGR